MMPIICRAPSGKNIFFSARTACCSTYDDGCGAKRAGAVRCIASTSRSLIKNVFFRVTRVQRVCAAYIGNIRRGDWFQHDAAATLSTRLSSGQGELFKYQFVYFIDIVFTPNINAVGPAQRPTGEIARVYEILNYVLCQRNMPGVCHANFDTRKCA